MKAGIQNKSTRVYNLAVRTPKGKMVHVNLIPGFNVVDKSLWKAFVNGDKVHPYVKTLKGNGMLSWGKELDAQAERLSSQHKDIYDKEVANAKVPSKEVSAPKSNKVDLTDDGVDVVPEAVKPEADTSEPTPPIEGDDDSGWLD